MSDERSSADDLELEPLDLTGQTVEGVIISYDEAREMMREMRAIAEGVATALATLRDEAQKASFVFGWATEEMAKTAEKLSRLGENGNT